jgi:hypothetical protein
MFLTTAQRSSPSAQRGFFLTFRHRGTRDFTVRIFDGNLCRRFFLSTEV